MSASTSSPPIHMPKPLIEPSAGSGKRKVPSSLASVELTKLSSIVVSATMSLMTTSTLW
jgi:hypothetical protein